MPAVISDIIENNSAVITRKGWEIARVFIVSGLTALPAAMLQEAVSIVGVPVIGDAHPEVTTAYAWEIQPEAITTASNQVRITVTYREFDTLAATRYQLSGDATEEETTLDFEGNEVELEYQFPADYPNPDYAGGLPKKIIHKARKLVPRPTIRITRFEILTLPADGASGLELTGRILTARMINFIGKTNLPDWNLEPSAVISEWLCYDISAVKTPDQITWEVSYTFKYDVNLWGELAQFIDFNTGQIPDDLVDGTGIKLFSKYPSVNFSLLQLS